MGMINDSNEHTSMNREEVVETVKRMMFGVQPFNMFSAEEREALDKAYNDKACNIVYQYETHLKAKMVTMLTELKVEINEKLKGENK